MGIIACSPNKNRNAQEVDRESAYELLKQKAERMPKIAAQQEKPMNRRGLQSTGEAM